MASNFGQAIGIGVDRLARGLALGQNLRAAEEQRGLAAEDQAFAREQREQARKGWQQQDQDRASQQRARQLAAAYKLIQNGAYEPNTPQGQKTLGYVKNMMGVFDNIENPDPQTLNAALASFNERHAEDINKGAGIVTDTEFDIGGGQKLPKGSKIEGKRITRAIPLPNGGLRFGVTTTATTPDGKPVEWENFVTQNRSMADDDPALTLSVDDLYKTVDSDMQLMDLVQQQGRDKALALLEAELTALGADIPTAPKLDEFKREEGNEIVTYQRDPRGNVKEVARAPRWQPEKADKPTSGMQEYELAKREGFKGSYLDFVQAKKGQGFSVTTPDGTVVQMGGPAGGGSLAKPTLNNLEETIVNAQAGLDRLRQVGRDFDPSFLKLQNQLGANVAKWKDKIGAASPEDREKIKEYETFRSGVLNNLNLYIKEITGAAMSQQEAVRIIAAMPSMDDGPTQFRSKYDRVVEGLSRALARAYYTRQNGLSMDAVPIEQMDKIIDDYGGKIEKQIKAQNPDMDQAEVERLAMDQVRRAFGM
jgi:hypothetical protein